MKNKTNQLEEGIEKIIKICEWHMCSEKATCLEAFEGRLLDLCTLHRKALKAQKKANNNI